MRIEDFDFELPDSAIARHPAEKRDASRLMVLDRANDRIEHCVFAELPALLRPEDLLVVNDTRVLPARLRGRKADSGGKVEVLLVEPIDESPVLWRAMVNASKPVRAGGRIELEGGASAEVTREEGEGFVVLALSEPAAALAARSGEIPLPPYLLAARVRGPLAPRSATPSARSAPLSRSAVEAEDRDRYQTVYAQGPERSVAAPTAGLHFTPALLEQIRHARITLHVGPGTFLPVRVEEIEAHRMLPERYELSAATAQTIEQTRGRVVAVGTTVTRVLETVGRPLHEARGATDLFIRPGHRFSVVQALITNFHLPRSTLLMLVSAFAGRERILAAYQEAIARGYRFFSYGDAMLIL